MARWTLFVILVVALSEKPVCFAEGHAITSAGLIQAHTFTLSILMGSSFYDDIIDGLGKGSGALSRYRGGGLIGQATRVFTWLQQSARAVWYSIQRWWGGSVEKNRIWSDYKEARNKIAYDRTLSEGLKRTFVADLRAEFRDEYPHYAHLWN
eukprot:TRINITY_DN45050_c0_g1_i1.p1 TRINITY_DN45050_c0_g1~~TRINITY_DN45050_c0_g1_i1.p1  ORF type:complete len:168 (-),score=16.04 TRINITY_DN45050_c0_g1_i1:40-495(-)